MISTGSGSFVTENRGVCIVSYTGNLPVDAGADSNFLTITPPVGERWDILFFRSFISSPGGTTGVHNIEASLRNATSHLAVLYAKSTFGSGILIDYNSYVSVDSSKYPTSSTGLMNNISRLFLTSESILRFNYNNQTDANQTGDYEITLTYQVSKF